MLRLTIAFSFTFLSTRRPGSVERITSGSVPSDLVTTSAWQKLLLRVGTDVMKYLLLHSSIFVTQGNEWGKRFYMQATGSPIGHDAYRKMKGGTKKRRICLPRVDLFKIQASRKDATGTAGFSSTHELMTLSAKELLQRIFLADLEDGQKSSAISASDFFIFPFTSNAQTNNCFLLHFSFHQAPFQRARDKSHT